MIKQFIAVHRQSRIAYYFENKRTAHESIKKSGGNIESLIYGMLTHNLRANHIRQDMQKNIRPQREHIIIAIKTHCCHGVALLAAKIKKG